MWKAILVGLRPRRQELFESGPVALTGESSNAYDVESTDYH